MLSVVYIVNASKSWYEGGIKNASKKQSVEPAS
jgi:hypothetical protein